MTCLTSKLQLLPPGHTSLSVFSVGADKVCTGVGSNKICRDAVTGEQQVEAKLSTEAEMGHNAEEEEVVLKAVVTK